MSENAIIDQKSKKANLKQSQRKIGENAMYGYDRHPHQRDAFAYTPLSH